MGALRVLAGPPARDKMEPPLYHMDRLSDLRRILEIGAVSATSTTRPDTLTRKVVSASMQETEAALSSWDWKWEKINFNALADENPNVLNILLGKRFSAGSCHYKPGNEKPNCDAFIENSPVSSTGIKINAEDELKSTAYLNASADDRELEEGELEEGEILDTRLEASEERKEAAVCVLDQETGELVNTVSCPPEDGNTSLEESIGLGQNTENHRTDHGSSSEECSHKKEITSYRMENKCKMGQANSIQRFTYPQLENSSEGASLGQHMNDEMPDGCKAHAQETRNVKESAKGSPSILETSIETRLQEFPNRNAGANENLMSNKDLGPLSSFVEIQASIWENDTVDDVVCKTMEEVAKRKAKRGPMTEQRKEKRKASKRKKKALKNKELGVKRLKLKPVQKPKPLTICKYYMKGKCLQGKDCSFSHDSVPETKSQMCKYHVNRRCLKGDDCPFSHDLSSFPCKYFHVKGHCSAGDNCRFSHKPMDENALQAFLKQLEEIKQGSETQSMHDDCATRSSIALQTLGVKKFPSEHASVASSTMDFFSRFPPNSQRTAQNISDVLDQNSAGKFSGEEPSKFLHGEQHNRANEQTHTHVSYPLCSEQFKMKDIWITEGLHEAVLEARKVALNSVNPVVYHDAKLMSCGLARSNVLTSMDSTDNSINGNRYAGVGITHVPNCAETNDHGRGHQEARAIRFLNSSKSAIEILEDMFAEK